MQDVIHEFGPDLHKRRLAANLSQRGLARRASCSQHYISLIEQGHRIPSDAVANGIDDALGTDGWFLNASRRARRQRDVEKHALADLANVRTPYSQPDTSCDANPNPRELVNVAAKRAREFALSHQGSLPPETVEQVFDEVRTLAVTYPRSGSEILPDLADVQNAVFTLLEQRQRSAQSRQLYFLAGITGGLLAKVSHDLAEPLAAMTHARTAYLCADHADSNALRAWVRGLQSLITYWDGRHRESLHYATSGAQFAGTGTASVWLSVSEARGWAALGNAVEARAALQRAEGARERATLDDLDELGGICTFGRARQAYYAAEAFSWLPDEADAAASHAARAVTAYEDVTSSEWAFGDQAGSYASLAIARVAQGELSGVTEAIAPILQLPPVKRLNGVLHSVRRVHNAVSHSPLRAERSATQLQEEIEAFARAPLGVLPR